MVAGSMVKTSPSSSGWGTPGSSTWMMVTAARQLPADEVACSQVTMQQGSMCASPWEGLMLSCIDLMAAACLG